mmetsp:Transcript_165511/g.531132  ORF Transcript_165511/g.531132 Transcript_165511/m.531132 type:complete len:197 (+) Transcript_165511:62-652(+)
MDDDLMAFSGGGDTAASPMMEMGDPLDTGAATPVSPMAPAADMTADPMSFAGGYTDPFQGMPTSNDAMGGGGGGMAIPEMTKLREWEEKHQQDLDDASRNEQGQKLGRKEAASAELKTWYETRTTTLSKRSETNRTNEKASEGARAEAMAPGANPWERVVELIDSNVKTADVARDTSRMRALLIQLKSNPIVSTAA